MFSAAFGFVVVSGMEIEAAEGLDDGELLAPTDIFGQRRGERLLLGLMRPGPPRLFDQLAVKIQVG